MINLEASTISEIWSEIEKVLNENPAPFIDLNVVYQFDIRGDDGGTYQLNLLDGKATVSEEVRMEPQCTLKMKEADFKKLLKGKLNSTAAYMMGKLQVKGSLGLALKMEGLLKQYQF